MKKIAVNVYISSQFNTTAAKVCETDKDASYILRKKEVRRACKLHYMGLGSEHLQGFWTRKHLQTLRPAEAKFRQLLHQNILLLHLLALSIFDQGIFITLFTIFSHWRGIF